MKKSEMVELIENAMSDGDSRQADFAAPDHNAIAAFILNAVLKAGMIPPIMEFKMGDNVIRDNGWENEDG